MEAFIGVLYIFSLAGSILILDRTPHGLEEFKAILNGNILWVTPSDLLKTFILYAAIGLLHLVFRKKFFALSYEESNGPFWEFLFFLSFAFVLVSSVQLAGILQVFSFLVIPALIGRLFTRSADEDPGRGMGDRAGGQHGRHYALLQTGPAHGAAHRRVLERRIFHAIDVPDRVDAAIRFHYEY